MMGENKPLLSPETESMSSDQKTLTTEDVVNKVAEKPTPLYVTLMFGLMTFNTVRFDEIPEMSDLDPIFSISGLCNGSVLSKLRWICTV